MALNQTIPGKVEQLRQQYAVDVDPVALETDPHPILEVLRKEKPVAWVPAFGVWFITRWDDVIFVNSNPELFTAETEPSIAARALGPNMMTLEGEKTRRLKTAMQPPFTARGPAGTYIREQIDAVADVLIDGFIDRGEVEVMTEYAQPLATQSLQIVLGLDNVSHEELWDLSQGLIAGFACPQPGSPEAEINKAAKTKSSELISAKIEEKKQFPDNTGISCLANLQEANLGNEEIINNVRLMLSGGINEPRDGIGTLTWHLCSQHSEMKEQLLNDANAWMPYVTELFRLHPPVGKADRQTTQEVEIGGMILPAGEMLAAVYVSANRDERHFDNPDEFNLQRQDKQHLAFGYGQHECLGRWLGTREVIGGVQRLFNRLANLRIQEDIELFGFEFRGPRSLKVCWDT